MQAEIGLSMVEAMKSWASEGLSAHAVPTHSVVVESHGNFREAIRHLHNATAMAPDEGARMVCRSLAIFFAVDYPRKLCVDDCDLDAFFGPGGCWVRDIISSNNFECNHPTAKNLGFKTDMGCTGTLELALLLHYGDLAHVKVGFANSLATLERIDQNIASGEATLDGYTYEIWLAVHLLVNGAYLAGELEVVRSFLQLQCVQELMQPGNTGLTGFWSQWGEWETDGHKHSRRGSWVLILRSMAATLDEDTETSRAALREWLPSADELLHIAQFEDAFRTHAYGQMHPALLCASLHGERLGDWQVALRVSSRLLELEAFNPLLRVASLRLLSRSRYTLGMHEEACAAAERAADDAVSAKCWWLEMLAVHEQLRCLGGAERGAVMGAGEQAQKAVRARLVKAVSKLATPTEDLAMLLGVEPSYLVS